MTAHRERFVSTEERTAQNNALIDLALSRGRTWTEARVDVMVHLIKNGKINQDILFRKHFQAWNYLYEHPELDKYDVPVVLEHYDVLEYFHLCFLCFAAQVPVRTKPNEAIWEKLHGSYCKGCPLSEAGYRCSEHESLYWRWNYAEDPDTRKLLAKQIRDVVKSKF